MGGSYSRIEGKPEPFKVPQSQSQGYGTTGYTPPREAKPTQNPPPSQATQEKTKTAAKQVF